MAVAFAGLRFVGFGDIDRDEAAPGNEAGHAQGWGNDGSHGAGTISGRKEIEVGQDRPQGRNGVVHTHSPYATAFAALGRPIPVYLTAIADEFGGPIPCAGFALIGGEEIGRQVIQHIGASPAVLLKNHGVFTVGPSARAAVKAAVMTEDVARTVWYALQLGTPDEIAPADVASLHRRYTQVYGQ